MTGIGNAGMKKLIPAALLSLLCAASARAAFEDVETGARAAAMSGALTAQPAGVSSLFYNPAGVIGLTRYEAALSQEKLFAGLSDGSSLSRGGVAFGAPLYIGGAYWGSAAFGWDVLSLDSLYSESRMRLAYAYPVRDNLWAGLAVARLGVTYGTDDYSALNPVFNSATEKSALGIDLGAIYSMETMDLGLSIQNANEPDLGIKYPSKVDRKISLGLARNRETYTWDFDLVFAGGDLKLKTGAELPVRDGFLGGRLLARGGLALGSREYRAASAGFGYRGDTYSIDYAFSYPLSGIAGTMGSHQLGAHFAFGTPRGPLNDIKQREADRKEKEAYEKQEAEKARKELEAGTGAGVTQKTGPTKEEIAEGNNLARQARVAMRKGLYAEAYEGFKKADVLLISDQGVKDFLAKMLAVKTILPQAASAEERDDLIRKSLNRYADKITDAVLYITYARQKWPKDTALLKLYYVVAQEFPETAAGMRMLPGISIIDQLLQDALDFIRNGRYIQAISTLQMALQLEPDNIPALTRMGSAYWAMEKKDVAREKWQRVIELDPKNKEVIQFMKMN